MHPAVNVRPLALAHDSDAPGMYFWRKTRSVASARELFVTPVAKAHTAVDVSALGLACQRDTPGMYFGRKSPPANARCYVTLWHEKRHNQTGCQVTSKPVHTLCYCCVSSLQSLCRPDCNNGTEHVVKSGTYIGRSKNDNGDTHPWRSFTPEKPNRKQDARWYGMRNEGGAAT